MNPTIETYTVPGEPRQACSPPSSVRKASSDSREEARDRKSRPGLACPHTSRGRPPSANGNRRPAYTPPPASTRSLPGQTVSYKQNDPASNCAGCQAGPPLHEESGKHVPHQPPASHSEPPAYHRRSAHRRPHRAADRHFTVTVALNCS